MSPQEWVGLALRWTHFIAGIAWIGSSFYFIWLDAHLERVLTGAPDAARDPDLEGSLWMVHSGGFYRVERRKVGPGRMPATLHWFKWEAAITWASGALLLGLLYYSTRGLYLTDPLVSSLSPRAAMLLGLAAGTPAPVSPSQCPRLQRYRAPLRASLRCCCVHPSDTSADRQIGAWTLPLRETGRKTPTRISPRTT
jgi:hypothetical protein